MLIVCFSLWDFPGVMFDHTHLIVQNIVLQTEWNSWLTLRLQIGLEDIEDLCDLIEGFERQIRLYANSKFMRRYPHYSPFCLLSG